MVNPQCEETKHFHHGRVFAIVVGFVGHEPEETKQRIPVSLRLKYPIAFMGLEYLPTFGCF